jgi:hypothetical protein
MSGDNPFRSELDAAHRRIEQLEADHEARVSRLEGENARLRQRLIDVAPGRTRTGRTFGALAMVILGVSLVVGMLIAHLTRSTMPTPVIPVLDPIELTEGANEPTNEGEFNRAYIANVLDHVHIEDCAKPASAPSNGHVRLVIAPTGTIVTALVDQGPLRDTPVGHCIEDRYRAARVPPFSGPPRAVGKSFSVP